jgi:hypothetical protein
MDFAPSEDATQRGLRLGAPAEASARGDHTKKPYWGATCGLPLFSSPGEVAGTLVLLPSAFG